MKKNLWDSDPLDVEDDAFYIEMMDEDDEDDDEDDEEDDEDEEYDD